MSTHAIDFQPEPTAPFTNPSAQRPSGFVPQSGQQALPTGTGESDPIAERNRQNAQHSTGPRTAEGKAASSRNSLKFGLSIQRHAVLKHEDPAEFEQLRVELREIFRPNSPRESLAVEDIAECRWALRRFDEGESKLLDYHFGHGADPALRDEDRVSYGEALGYVCIQEPDEPPNPEYPSFLLLQRYRAHWDRRLQRGLAEFDRAQRSRRQEACDQRQQTESLRKAEREADAERRREEAHGLNMQILAEKLEQQRRKTTKAGRQNEEEEIDAMLKRFVNAPPPGLAVDELCALGFVSSGQLKPDAEARITSQGDSAGTV